MTALVVVTGSRDWVAGFLVADKLSRARLRLGEITVLHGGLGRGADRFAAGWCLDHGVAHESFWPDPPVTREKLLARNAAMIDRRPDLVLAFVTPTSRGTWHTVTLAMQAGIEVQATHSHVATAEFVARSRRAAAALVAHGGWRVARRRSLALLLNGVCVGDPIPPGLPETIAEIEAVSVPVEA